MITDSTEPMQLDAESVVTTFNNYGEAWAWYIGLTLLLAGLIWFTFRKQYFLLKWFLTSIVLAGALCFGHPAENVETYSPLILNTMVELFDGNKAQFYSDIKFIAMVWGILFTSITAMWLLIRFLINKKRSDGDNAQENAQESSDSSNDQVETQEPYENDESPNEDKEKSSQTQKPVEPTIGDDI